MFSFISKAAIALSVERVAQKAASLEAFDRGVGAAFSHDVVKQYFQKYGSTARKFEYHPDPGFYIGYVQVPSRDEFLSVVIMQEKGSVIASFEPEMMHSDDVLGLIGKREFSRKISEGLIRNSRK